MFLSVLVGGALCSHFRTRTASEGDVKTLRYVTGNPLFDAIINIMRKDVRY